MNLLLMLQQLKLDLLVLLKLNPRPMNVLFMLQQLNMDLLVLLKL